MDKKLNEVTKVTDMAYVPVIMADGSIGQIAKSDLASVVAGVIGVATNKKNGLLEASSFVKLLSSNYILYKIASIGSNLWSRKSFSIKGAYNAIPYEYIGGIYYSGSTSSFAVKIKSVLSKQSHIKFYEKGGDIYVFFNIPSQDLNYALFSSEHEITQMSIGNQSIIDSSYTEIDVTSDVFGYNSLAELAGGVAEQMGAFRTYPLGIITDANDAYSGIFPFNMANTIANTGGNIGLLIHYSGPDERYATQICTIFSSQSTIKIRHRYNDSWSDWSTIQ